MNPGRGGGAQPFNSKQGLGTSPLEMALGHLKSVRARISEAYREKWQLYGGCEKVNLHLGAYEAFRQLRI